MRSALGNSAVACPSLSLSPTTFGVAAKAAVSAAGKGAVKLLVVPVSAAGKAAVSSPCIFLSMLFAGLTLASDTSPTAFNPYTVEDHFWLAAFIFEVGETLCLIAAASVSH